MSGEIGLCVQKVLKSIHEFYKMNLITKEVRIR